MPEETVTTAAPATEGSASNGAAPLAPPPAASSVVDSAAGGEPAKPSIREVGDMARRRAGLEDRAKAVRERERAAASREKKIAEDVAQAKREAAELRAELAEIRKGNPLLRKDVDPEAAVKDFLAQGTPEAKLTAYERDLAEEKAARLALEKRLDEGEAKRKTEEDASRVRAIAADEQGRINRFTGIVTGAERAKYPYLNAEFTPPEVAALTRQANEQAKAQKWKDPSGKWHTGATYSFEEVANSLEEHARQVYKTREDRRKTLLTGSQEPPATTPRANGSPGSGRRAPVQAPRVSETPKPKIARRMSREEEAEADIAALKKATALDSAERAKRDKRLGR